MAAEGVNEVKQILDQLGLGAEYQKLADDGYETLADMRAMLEADFIDCGLKKGHAKRIMRYFSENNSGASGVMSPTRPAQPKPEGVPARPAKVVEGDAAAAVTMAAAGDTAATTAVEDGAGTTETTGDSTVSTTTPSTVACVQMSPDGTKIEVFADNAKHTLQTNKDGSTIESFPDGTVISKDVGGTVHVQRADGSRKQTNPDGTIIEVSAEGVTTQTMGSTVYVEKPDGTKKQTDLATGDTIEIFADGIRIDTDKEGFRIITYPDGRRIQRNPNGTVIETWSDGHRIQTRLNGERIEIFPDGRRLQTDGETGKTMEHMPDGTVTECKLDVTKTVVNCSRCNTMVSVPRDKFVVSCPMCHFVLIASQQDVLGTVDGKMDDEAHRTGQGTAPSCRQKEIETIFAKYDINGDKAIDASEIGKMLQDLHFPENTYEHIFKSADANEDNVLQIDEFYVYFNQLNTELLKSAQAPVIEMTKGILEQQKKALDDERARLEARNKELLEKVASSELEAEQSKNAALIEKLKAETHSKANQLKDAIDADRERQRSRFKARLEARRLKKEAAAQKVDEQQKI